MIRTLLLAGLFLVGLLVALSVNGVDLGPLIAVLIGLAAGAALVVSLGLQCRSRHLWQ